MASASQFHLKIQHIEQTCLFELTWKQGLRLSATVDYPAELSRLFHEWQRLYIEFYNKPDISLAESSSESPLKERVAERGVQSRCLNSKEFLQHDPHDCIPCFASEL